MQYKITNSCMEMLSSGFGSNAAPILRHADIRQRHNDKQSADRDPTQPREAECRTDEAALTRLAS